MTAVLTKMGLTLIIYIDDILIMAELETLLMDHIQGIIYFLGFLVDSNAMELKLPGDKLENIWGEAEKILTSAQLWNY